ncbi:hypothetical protein NE237_002365 [Protea cynaroides]|uniref:Uncharacterized protein n=1 Tax=Protea cynaroides TaxID=273540 RepID=A0A9Q0KW03_9MAGN|nr:hypothetical protein NE237_002365 [Protea cynaroides]
MLDTKSHPFTRCRQCCDSKNLLKSAQLLGGFEELLGVALEIMELFPDLALAGNDKGITALHLLPESPLSFRSGTVYSACLKLKPTMNTLKDIKSNYHIASLPWVHGVIDAKQKHKNALEVVKQLVARENKHSRLNYYVNHGEDPHHSSTYDLQWNKLKVLSGQNSNLDPLLQATKCGITEVIQVILEEFPDAIEVRQDWKEHIPYSCGVPSRNSF